MPEFQNRSNLQSIVATETSNSHLSKHQSARQNSKSWQLAWLRTLQIDQFSAESFQELINKYAKTYFQVQEYWFGS